MYKALYSKLSDEYKIAVVEKPGYGFAGPMTTKRTVENMVEESRDEEMFEETIFATENAKKTASSGVIKCPAFFFVSNMRGLVKRITWQDAGKEYAQQCGGEVHMTDRGHMFYNYIPDEVTKTIKIFINNLKL